MTPEKGFEVRDIAHPIFAFVVNPILLCKSLPRSYPLIL
jgi:hypothetical protein